MSRPAKNANTDAIARLCTVCGLCCNGVLFGDVELQPRDAPEDLRVLGLKLERKGKKLRLRQPCPCLGADLLCRVYAERPVRCRTFECRVLQRVQRGELKLDAALRVIARARKQTAAVERLVETLGNTDRHLPLNRRYALIMAHPIDLSDDALVMRRSELMLAVHTLMKTLEREFL
jgi:Fe-S-cluster containining protein